MESVHVPEADGCSFQAKLVAHRGSGLHTSEQMFPSFTVTQQTPLWRNRLLSPSHLFPNPGSHSGARVHARPAHTTKTMSPVPWRCMLWCLQPAWCMVLRRAAPVGLGCPGLYPEHSGDSDTWAPLWRLGCAPIRQSPGLDVIRDEPRLNRWPNRQWNQVILPLWCNSDVL